MGLYAIRRIFGLVPVLLIAVVLTFIANQFVPGDPIMILLSDQSGDPVLEARLRADYGLDRPIFEQFITYMQGIFTGDFGLSFRFANVPGIDVIKTGLFISPILAISALAIAVPLGIVLGTFAALNRDTLADTAVILVLVAGISIPNFAMAALLVFFIRYQTQSGTGGGLGVVQPSGAAGDHSYRATNGLYRAA